MFCLQFKELGICQIPEYLLQESIYQRTPMDPKNIFGIPISVSMKEPNLHIYLLCDNLSRVLLTKLKHIPA
jgi:hypothetical protein